MAPPLFRFIMQAAFKTFETISNLVKLEFRHPPFATDPTNQRWRLQGQETKIKGKTLLINNLLIYLLNLTRLGKWCPSNIRPPQKIWTTDASQIGWLEIKNGSNICPIISRRNTTYENDPWKDTTKPRKQQYTLHKKFQIPWSNNHRWPYWRCWGQSLNKKAWSQMGMLCHLFKSKDIDWRVKYLIYCAAPLNTLLWGAELWNLNNTNQNKLVIFHHSVIRYILNIKWEQMREQKISKEEVGSRFENMPEIDFFITRYIWTYIRKIVCAPEHSILKKLTGAWIHCP